MHTYVPFLLSLTPNHIISHPSRSSQSSELSSLCYIAASHYLSVLHTAAAAKSLQSCPTLCDPIDGSPPGSPVPGILQARVLEWGAIAFFQFYTQWCINVNPSLPIHPLPFPPPMFTCPFSTSASLFLPC